MIVASVAARRRLDNCLLETQTACIHHDALDSVPASLGQTDGDSNAISARVTANERHTSDEGVTRMDRVGHAVTVAKGSFESKELLLCFTLPFFFFFFF